MSRSAPGISAVRQRLGQLPGHPCAHPPAIEPGNRSSARARSVSGWRRRLPPGAPAPRAAPGPPLPGSGSRWHIGRDDRHLPDRRGHPTVGAATARSARGSGRTRWRRAAQRRPRGQRLGSSRSGHVRGHRDPGHRRSYGQHRRSYGRHRRIARHRRNGRRQLAAARSAKHWHRRCPPRNGLCPSRAVSGRSWTTSRAEHLLGRPPSCAAPCPGRDGPATTPRCRPAPRPRMTCRRPVRRCTPGPSGPLVGGRGPDRLTGRGDVHLRAAGGPGPWLVVDVAGRHREALRIGRRGGDETDVISGRRHHDDALVDGAARSPPAAR